VSAGTDARPHPSPPGEGAVARLCASLIRAAFDFYREEFSRITRRAPARFERLDWPGMQADAVERLDLYGRVVARLVEQLQPLVGERIHERRFWVPVKRSFSDLISQAPNLELARTFFNSVTRRVFETVGVDESMEFVAGDFEYDDPDEAEPVHIEFKAEASTVEVIGRVLSALPSRWRWRDRARDERFVAAAIDARCLEEWGVSALDGIDVLTPVFYRRKGAYLFGRIRRGGRSIPLVLALLHSEGGVRVDAVLLTEDEASIVLSFTRSYFHVETPVPRRVVRFLQMIVPRKPLAELYIAIGHNKHGKTEMYRGLMEHLESSTDRFVLAPGEAGLVMVVFTLPSHDVVFKVIRDRFAPPKATTRAEVKQKYDLVFRHDRAGRLVDAQAFEHFAFAKERFSADLLAELCGSAAESVAVDGDTVTIQHVYLERRVTPLNLYLAQASPDAAREAVLDYGQTVRDLAATNIFPGDLLLKNFGVTRHRRVIFYDYDELCLLSDCRFREMPTPSHGEEEMSAEPWFYVAPNDVFPEEFLTFMGLHGALRDAFLGEHAEILTPGFWRRVQRQISEGALVDIFPYAASRRLPA
jgi:isocitrate dehydrogenase kinase/phosphatase